MRVLFVCPRFPGGSFRGDQIRAAAQLRTLANRHEIHLVTHESLPQGHPARALVAGCASVTMVPRKPWRMLGRAAAAVFGRAPLQVALFDEPGLVDACRRVLAEQSIELMHVQLARLGGLLASSWPVPVVIDLVDALSMNLDSRAGLAPAFLRPLYRIESRRLRRFEARLLARCAGSVVSSPVDARWIGGPPFPVVAANGVDAAALPWRAPTHADQDLVFIGNWRYAPNREGLEWLLDAVMPRVWARVPGVRLRLVGADADALRRFRRDPRIEVIGRVDSVVGSLHRAAVALAPIRSGSGQSLKILEAMACGTPVVCTERAAAALDLVGSAAIAGTDDAGSFAARVLDLLADPGMRLRQAQAARQVLESRFTWDASHAVLEQVWAAARHRP